MQVIETNWGKIVRWGFNCEEHLRDLRKLNDSLSTHHPDYEEMCKRSDALNALCLDAISRADEVYRNNPGLWSEEAVAAYDKATDDLFVAYEALYDLCVREYPRDAHFFHYSYCI